MDRTALAFGQRYRQAVAKLARRMANSMTFGLAADLLPEVFREPMDQRLAKIEAARENLTDALTALEDLQTEAQANSRALTELTVRLDKAEERKSIVQKDIHTLRELAKLDAESVRKGLGIPTRGKVWLERGFAFVLGIVGSIIASWLWQLLHGTNP